MEVDALEGEEHREAIMSKRLDQSLYDAVMADKPRVPGDSWEGGYVQAAEVAARIAAEQGERNIRDQIRIANLDEALTECRQATAAIAAAKEESHG